jgi:hypothetical protein
MERLDAEAVAAGTSVMALVATVSLTSPCEEAGRLPGVVRGEQVTTVT